MQKTGIDKLIGRRFISCVVFVAFLLNSGIAPVRYAHAQEVFQLPQPGTRVNLSPTFMPPLLKGVKVYPDNPFKLDFILDKGDSASSDEDLKTESTRLIKYFLASITVPEKDLWVNLSPYEKNRIIPDGFGVTEMGRDLLAQDYMLKQITASVIYPEEQTGKEFWDKVYTEAQRRFGSTDVPIDTFNKVWIVPEKAVVYENKDSAYVVESRLKVLLEEDYLALEKGTAGAEGRGDVKETNKLSAQIVREVVIPILEKEVNEGKNFAQLRQVYHSLILALWFKDKIWKSILGQAYIDKNKVAGVDIADKAAKEKIWAQYVEAFKKGAYNYIKEDYDVTTQQTTPRKYFSGGVGLFKTRISKSHDRVLLPQGVSDRAMIIESAFNSVDALRPPDAAQNAWVQAEERVIKPEERDGQGRLLTKGHPSHLPEPLWRLVRTQKFKDWFGDWENDPEHASKIVDENGEPLIMYHVSPKAFTFFDKTRVGAYDYDVNGGKPRLQGGLGTGMFFSVRPDVLDKFSDGRKAVLYEVFLNLRKPVKIDQDDFRNSDDPVIRKAREAGLGVREKWDRSSLEERVVLAQEMKAANAVLEPIARKATEALLKDGIDGAYDRERDQLQSGEPFKRPSEDAYAVLVFEPESGAIKSIYNSGAFTKAGGKPEAVRDIFERTVDQNNPFAVQGVFEEIRRLPLYSAMEKDERQIQAGWGRLLTMAAEHPEDSQYLHALAMHLLDINTRKKTHVVNVVENAYRLMNFTDKDVEYFFSHLNEVRAKGDAWSLEERAERLAAYRKELGKVKALYEQLLAEYRRMLVPLAIFHDIGALSPEGDKRWRGKGIADLDSYGESRDWVHHAIGAALLPKLGVIPQQDVDLIETLVFHHGAIANVGIDFFKADILNKFDKPLRDLLLIFSIVDMSGRQDGTNAADKGLIGAFMKNVDDFPKRNDGIFVARRISRAFAPFEVSLEDRSRWLAAVTAYFKSSGRYAALVKNWKRVRVNQFDLFVRLARVSADAYARLLAQISDEVSRRFKDGEEVTLDTDIDFLGRPFGDGKDRERRELADVVYNRILSGKPVLFKVKEQAALDFQLKDRSDPLGFQAGEKKVRVLELQLQQMKEEQENEEAAANIYRERYPDAGIAALKPGQPSDEADAMFAEMPAGVQLLFRGLDKKEARPFTPEERKRFPSLGQTSGELQKISADEVRSIRQGLYDRSGGDFNIPLIIIDKDGVDHFDRVIGINTTETEKLRAATFSQMRIPGAIVQISAGNQADQPGNFTAVSDGRSWKLFAAADEDFSHPYRVLVQFPEGRRELMLLYFKWDGGQFRVYRNSSPAGELTDELLPGDAEMVLSATPLFWDGVPTDKLLQERYIRSADLRHLFRFPNGNVFYAEVAGSQENLEAAFAGKPVEIDVKDVAKVRLLDAIGYQNVKEAGASGVKAPGQYWFSETERKLKVVLLPARYPLNALVVGPEGKVASVVIQGLSGRIGANYWTVGQWISEQVETAYGWAPVAVLALDNGMDPTVVRYREDGSTMSLAKGGRDRVNASLSVMALKRSAETAVSEAVPAGLTGDDPRSWDHPKVTGVRSLITTAHLEEFQEEFNMLQEDAFHKEGPTLMYHLQAMLDGVNAVAGDGEGILSGYRPEDILPAEYRDFIRQNRDFFEWFILLHDLGKKATKEKDEKGVFHYYFHEAESAGLVEARRILERNEQLSRYPLLKVIRLHMGPFMKGYADAKKAGRLTEYFDSYVQKNKLTLEEFKFLVIAVFIDMYYPRQENKYFFNDMARIKDAVAYLNEKKMNKGGIDLTRDKMGLQVQGLGSGVQFGLDPAMIQQLQNSSGLTPVIIDIHPMTTPVPVFLGLSDKEDKAEALSML